MQQTRANTRASARPWTTLSLCHYPLSPAAQRCLCHHPLFSLPATATSETLVEAGLRRSKRLRTGVVQSDVQSDEDSGEDTLGQLAHQKNIPIAIISPVCRLSRNYSECNA
ncbi:hypothetical protein C8Q80DRAFT_1353315, partial [Daedaleopsis nitida]